jgi:hypothetical protein
VAGKWSQRQPKKTVIARLLIGRSSIQGRQ